MKIFQILNGHIHYELTGYGSLDEAKACFSDEIELVEAPDYVFRTWGFDHGKTGDDRFIRPEAGPGWEYDDATGTFWNPETHRASERKQKHSETTDDTMQALRKLREGDTSLDWQAWLDALDAYNLAIEATKTQEGYPLKVDYPEYPPKPSA